jgi:hypothetical protein
MEARATFKGAAVSRTFVAAVLVVVAMGLSAMAGYTARSIFGNGATVGVNNAAVHPAAGTVLRQDNPVQAPAQLPDWIEREITQKPVAPIIVDDPNYYDQYLTKPAAGPANDGYWLA